MVRFKNEADLLTYFEFLIGKPRVDYILKQLYASKEWIKDLKLPFDVIEVNP